MSHEHDMTAHNNTAPTHARRTPLKAAARLLAALALATALPLATAQPAAAQDDAQAAAAARAQQREAFEQQAQALQQRLDEGDEQAVLQLLELAVEINQPYRAHLVVSNFLARQAQPSDALLLAAADNALLAGQYQQAVARYKRYLDDAEPNARHADVAAKLYRIQIELLRNFEDAYLTMRAHDNRFRQSLAARQFDPWFIAQARQRDDLAAMARRLELVLSEELPLELERLLYWDQLDWLFTRFSSAQPATLEARDAVRKLPDLLRGDVRRPLRWRLYLSHLDFRAEAQGMEPEQQAERFAPVLEAAKQYFDALPDAGAFRNVWATFVGGYATGFDNDSWDQVLEQKRQFTLHAFARLSDEDTRAILNWSHDRRRMVEYIASSEQWLALGVEQAELFRTTWNVRYLPLVLKADNVETFRQQASFVGDAESESAAVVRAMSLAEGDDGLHKAVRHYMEQESWNLPSGSAWQVLRQYMWPSFRSFARAEDKALPSTFEAEFYAHFGRTYVWSTPLAAFDPDTVRDTLTYAWQSQGEDKSAFIADLESLNWVPYSAEQRTAVYKPVHDEVKKWTQRVRDGLAAAQKADEKAQAALDQANEKVQEAEKALAALTQQESPAQAKVDEAKKQLEELRQAVETAQANKAQTQQRIEAQQQAMATADEIEQAFRRVESEQVTDPAAAPNDTCRLLAELILARRGDDSAAYVAVAQQLYAKLKQFEQDRPILGRTLFEQIVNNRAASFDIYDFQLEVLKDQFAQMDATTFHPLNVDVRNRIGLVVGQIMDGRREWRWGRVPVADQKKVLELNAVLADGLNRLLDQQAYWPTLFNWVRDSRKGDGWQADSANEALFSRMIEEQTLAKHDHVPIYDSPASSYQHLVYREWPGLREKYPPQSYFDAMFIEQARKTRFLDNRYWSYGRDEQGNVRRAAAEIFASFDYLPYGWTDAHRDPVYSNRGDFHDWHNQIYQADADVWQPMHEMLLATYGKTRFDALSMGAGWFVQADASNAEGQAAFFEHLDAYLTRMRARPDQGWVPNMQTLSRIDPATLSDEALAVLLRIFPSADDAASAMPNSWSTALNHGELIRPIVAALHQRGRHDDLLRLAPHLWRIAWQGGRDEHHAVLTQFTQQLLNENEHELAAIYASIGLDVMGNALSADMSTALRAVQSRSMVEIGRFMLVSSDDEHYPIFKAQADYLTGLYAAAWAQYLEHQRMAVQAHGRLDPTFIIWLINQNAEKRRFDEAQSLARAMAQWTEAASQGLDPELLGQLMLAEANIAFVQQEYPRARIQYERLALNEAFAGTAAQRNALLRIANIDRLTHNYDRALRELEQLARRPDRVLQTEAFHLLALTKFDQEAYVEAGRYVQEALLRDPGHAETKILQGQIFIKLNQLEPATQIETGLRTDRRYIVPGEPLRVTLEDRNLAVVGSAADIRLTVTTSSGDEEEFHLFPYADSQTRFQGQIRTTLGDAKPGDRVLQLRGNDQVTYDFADRSERGADDAAAAGAPPALTVVTDAQLAASSSRILSRDELAELELERRIRERLRLDAGGDAAPLSQQRHANQVKPGNPINVRVIDLDRSVSGERDRIEISVNTSSGDRIDAFTLTETDPNSGIFEGAIPTAPGQASAFATDSREGRDPNFTTSAKTYPAWQALADNARPKLFGVDLNDNVALGSMRVTANVPGRKLQQLLVQTSLDGRNYRTLGGWPEAVTPWDGSPRVSFVRVVGARPAGYEALRDYVAHGHLGNNAPKVTAPIKTIAGQYNHHLDGHAEAMRIDRREWYVAHFQAAFVLTQQRASTFRIDPKDRLKNVSYVLAIDGRPAEDRRNPLEITRTLEAGVHRVEVYLLAERNAGAHFVLEVDSDEPPFMVAAPAQMFDPEQHPAIREAFAVAGAEIQADEAAGTFDIRFGENARARLVRLVIGEYQTDAPAIEKITLHNAAGEQVLPTERDFMDLRENQTLEILPGDRVTMSYRDPTYLSDSRQLQEAAMQATYSNAVLSAAFVEYDRDARGNTRPIYIEMRRFKAGDRVNVFINDPDRDVSAEQDVVQFLAQAGEGDPIAIQALETEPHSGVFVGAIFPVREPPTRDTEIQIAPGEDLLLSYADTENTDPGIPWKRTARVEQARWSDPQLRVYEMSSYELEDAADGNRAAAAPVGRQVLEYVPSRRDLVVSRPDEPLGEQTARVMLPGPLVVELLHPPAARSPQSEVSIYVQTQRGRDASGKTLDENQFDIEAPGTINLLALPGDVLRVDAPPGYRRVHVRGVPRELDALDHGRFTLEIPLELGALPEQSLVRSAPSRHRDQQTALRVQGGERIYIGFRYEDEQGAERWLVRSVETDSDVFFDVMDRRYHEPMQGAYVGENVYLRVIEPAADRSDEKDELTLELRTANGRTQQLTLSETFSHSGVFKGYVQLVHEDDQQSRDNAVNAVLVRYGDTLSATYDAGAGRRFSLDVPVHMGADGEVLLFSKRFNDSAIAVQTQFTIAEAHFEQAKRHRELDQLELSRREIGQGKKLLEEAIRDYPDTEARAQAEYLLANLAFEYAEDANNEELRSRQYVEAVTLFSNIVSRYPDSPYAPRSQFKKALVLEKMGDIDQACEEYVRLAYRYPENTLVAETIARLGQYFLTKGQQLHADADAAKDEVDAEKLRTQARDMFKTAAEVFARLTPRFPDHQLAGKTRVLSGQCYMRAEMYSQAISTFTNYYEDAQRDPALAAEAMYWAADCQMKDNQPLEAYRTFKKLTWDYPESNWAKFARGRLTDDAMVRIEQQEARRQ